MTSTARINTPTNDKVYLSKETISVEIKLQGDHQRQLDYTLRNSLPARATFALKTELRPLKDAPKPYVTKASKKQKLAGKSFTEGLVSSLNLVLRGGPLSKTGFQNLADIAVSYHTTLKELFLDASC